MDFPIKKNPDEQNFIYELAPSLTLYQLRLYTEILRFDHKQEPDRLEYSIKYEHLTTTTEDNAIEYKNDAEEIDQIEKMMLLSYYKINEEMAENIFDKKALMSFNLFPCIGFDDENGVFDIEIHPSFKRILEISNFIFTKEETEFLRNLKSVFSLRFFWFIKKNNLKKSVFTINISDFKQSVGCNDKIRDDNLKSKVLNVIRKEFSRHGKAFDFEFQNKVNSSNTQLVFSFSS